MIYANDFVANFDDRVLTHIFVAVGTRMRRHESFWFTWTEDLAHESGRHTLWIDAHVPLRFEFSGGMLPSVNRRWVEQLVDSSMGGMGMRLTPEPTEDDQAVSR